MSYVAISLHFFIGLYPCVAMGLSSWLWKGTAWCICSWLHLLQPCDAQSCWTWSWSWLPLIQGWPALARGTDFCHGISLTRYKLDNLGLAGLGAFALSQDTDLEQTFGRHAWELFQLTELWLELHFQCNLTWQWQQSKGACWLAAL